MIGTQVFVELQGGQIICLLSDISEFYSLYTSPLGLRFNQCFSFKTQISLFLIKKDL